MRRYGIRIRRHAGDAWQRGRQFRRVPGKGGRLGWTFWRDSWPTRRAAELRLRQYQQAGWSGHVFRLPKPFTWRDHLHGNIVEPARVPRRYRRAYVATLNAVAHAAHACGERWRVNSSFRFYREQLALREAYLAGRGPLAAVPGTSAHEKGLALDVSGPDGAPVYHDGTRRRALEARGVLQTVPSEGWHAQRVR